MSILSFSTKEPIITVDKFKSTYLYGVDLRDNFGNELPDEALQSFLNIGIAEIEMDLYCPLTVRPEIQYVDFMAKNYQTFMYMQLPIYPIFSIDKVTLTYGEGTGSNDAIIEFPKAWYKVHKMSGQVEMLISYSSINQLIFKQISFINPMLSGNKYLPSLIKVESQVGLSDEDGLISPLINSTIGLIAAVQTLQVLGDIGSLGGNGVSSHSMQIDNLNQNVATTSTLGNLYKVTIDSYMKRIEANKKMLKKTYNRVNFSVA